MAGGIDAYTKLMLHCDGVDESTDFPDASDSNHTVTAQGTAQVDTAQSVFGGASCLLDGNSDYLSIPQSTDFNFGADNLTIDCRVRFTASQAGNILSFEESGSHCRIYCAVNYMNIHSGGSWTFTWKEITPALNLNQWYHFALVRNGTNWTIYIDGTEWHTATRTTTIGTPTSNILIGVAHPSITEFFPGWIDEFRVQKGEAVWTTNFTPPTEAYSVVKTIDIDETLNVSDDIQFLLNPELFPLDETVNVSDEIDFLLSEELFPLDESLSVSDDIQFVRFVNTYYATKIISYNPLIYVTLTDPAQIVEVDISVPGSPTKTVYDLVGVSNARDVVMNTTNNYFYVICDDGKIVKVDSTNLSSQTIISTGDSDTLQKVDVLGTHLRTFVSTDDSSGEIIVIDEATLTKLNTDLRWIAEITNTISTRLDTIAGKKIETDLRWIATSQKTISTDLRWIKYAYDTISQHPINRTSDIVIKINGTDMVALNDVKMDSGQIIHDINGEVTKGSKAIFVLNRRHDKLDFDNQGNASQITNNNAVVIEINGVQEFTGKISNIASDSEGETATVTAIGTRKTDKRNTIKIPMASVGDNVHLYQCFVHSPVIDEPYIDPRLVIQGANDLYWTGSAWNSNVTSATTFATWTLAEAYIDGISETNLTFHNNVPAVANYDATPEYYKGVSVELGTEIEQNITRYKSFVNSATLATELIDGDFKPKQNWTYFWLVKFTHLILGLTKATFTYIGTTLGSMSTDAWKITGASYHYQKIKDDVITDMGSYQVGSAPYNIISVKNGRKITKERYEDKKDGMYTVKDEGYDYEQFAKNVADLEYNKLKNVNGTILPVTTANIELSLDGYYYYGVSLLTRINVTNTTTANIYNGVNGFPVSVKSITVDLASMRVALSCSSQLSVVEMDEIDDGYPDEQSDEYLFPETESRVYRKFDPNSWSYPD